MNYTAIWTVAFPYIIIFGVFYLVLIMPQRKREKNMRQMLSSLKVGDKITTIGGIIGVILEINEDEICIESGTDKTKIRIARWSIRNVE